MYVPNEDYSASIVYDKELNIQEWYFDMIHTSGYDSKPFIEDLYLDVAVSPEGHVALLDEDELLEAYNKGIISENQVNKAYQTSDYIITELIPNMKFMKDFFYDLLEKMTQEKLAIKKSTYYDIQLPLYENHVNCTRFKIDEFKSSITDQVLLVEVLFKVLFDNEDEIMVIINCSDDHDWYEFLSQNHCLKRQMKHPKGNGLLSQYSYPQRVEQVNYIHLLENIIKGKCDQKLITDSDIFFTHFDKDVVFHLDWKGNLDIIGNETVLKELNNRYFHWIQDI
jgi:hypothetical protein